MKTFSKIAAIALMAAMTTCLTSCEEDSVPAYGTIMEEDTKPIRHELSPTPPVETVPTAPVEAFVQSAMIDNNEWFEYVAATVIVTNNTGTDCSIWDLIEVHASGLTKSGFPASLSSVVYNVTGEEYEDKTRIVASGEQTLSIWVFSIDDADTEYVDITVSSSGTETDSGYIEGDILDTQRYYLTEE